MESHDWFILLVAIIISILTLGDFFLTERSFTGQVSSIDKSCLGICVSNIEFYGGRSSMVFYDPRADSIKPNIECNWRTRGVFLQYVSCKGD